jgi:mRNA interferase MazF
MSTFRLHGRVVVVPITTANYGLRSHVELDPEASGLDRISYARCDEMRVVSVERLSARQGIIDPERIQAINQALRFILDL